MHEFGQQTALAVLPEQKQRKRCRFMQAGNVSSLVKRTLFETNSRARRSGKESLTSAQTRRLLTLSHRIVNPVRPESRRNRRVPVGARAKENFANEPKTKRNMTAPTMNGQVVPSQRHDRNDRQSDQDRKESLMNDNEEPRSHHHRRPRVAKQMGGGRKVSMSSWSRPTTTPRCAWRSRRCKGRLCASRTRPDRRTRGHAGRGAAYVGLAGRARGRDRDRHSSASLFGRCHRSAAAAITVAPARLVSRIARGDG